MDRGYVTKKEKHPKDRAGILSLLTFFYLFKIIRKGRKNPIEENDLSQVMKKLKAKKVGDDLEKIWEKMKITNPRPSLTKAIIKCFGKSLLFLLMMRIITNTIKIWFTPWAIGKFVAYFQENQTAISKEEALFYALSLSLIDIFDGLWKQHYSLLLTEMGIRIRTSISSLLYRKSLKLNQAKLGEITTGNIVTSLTKDVDAIDTAIFFGLNDINEVIEIIVVGYLLYQKVGMASIPGNCIIFISIICQAFLSKITYTKRNACNKKTDERLKQTQEVLSSIRLIKMYVWESFFEKRLLWLRKIELKNLYILYLLRSIAKIMGTISDKLSHVLTLFCVMWVGQKLDADIVYYLSRLFKQLSLAMVFIPLGIQAFSEFLVALKRINVVLYAEESRITTKDENQILKPEITFIGSSVKISKFDILNNINLKLNSGLNILIGASGCGKTSLLKTILEEYNITDGKIKINGTISYAPQNPWLFPSSLKQNILFGEKYNEKKYKEILEICGLTYDINTFKNGDETILTDCGANLSGGQQSRINLARAIYRESDIYLLDDCLSALDIRMKNYIFNKVIKDYLKDRLCILITHSNEFIREADNVIAMENGTVTFYGKPMDAPLSIIELKDKKKEAKSDNKKEIELDDTTDESTTLITKEDNEFKDNIYKEKQKHGRVSFDAYRKYIQYGGGWSVILFICSIYICCEILHGASEKFLSKWLNAQKASNVEPPIIYQDHSSKWELSTETSYVSTYLPISNVTTDDSNMKYFHYFVATTLFGTFFSFLGQITNFFFAMKIARNIHAKMIDNLLKSFMSFFDSHLIGNVLTRFSRDLLYVDETLPFLWQGVKMIFMIAMSLTLIISVKPMAALLLMFMGIVFYWISTYILPSMRNLQRLSTATLCPIIGHLNTTLDGLMIIRAHGAQEILKNEFDKHLDVSVTANHFKEISQNVMRLYFHFISSVFTTFITLQLLHTADVLAGDAGLILSQTNMVGHFIEIALMFWMYLETSMTSVERILEYTALKKENNKGQYLENWPNEGRIQFKNVNLTYRTDGEMVLKNLNFTIEPLEKIGIVGRTGAGKSSVIHTLFKLYEIGGDIIIDNISIKTLSLDCLRTHLAIIPQEPVIFTGTVRSNIDPYDTITDTQIWNILEIVHLKSHFESLDEDITKSNLSIGQKQLISIARALTRKRKIVILDEATANMDEKMNIFINEKIKELFKNCTVVKVAHRLNTITDSDRVIVMDKGEVVEFDTPKNLLANTKGIFYKMIHLRDGISDTEKSEKEDI